MWCHVDPSKKTCFVPFFTFFKKRYFLSMMKITLTLAQSCIFAARQSNVARLHSIPLFLHPAKGFSSVKKRSTTIINRRGGDKQFMATMSESNQDSNKVAKIYSNQEEEIELPISQFEYPLIDVDCNLLHEDLTGLLESSSSAYDVVLLL